MKTTIGKLKQLIKESMMTTVTVPASYSFALGDQDLEDKQANYGVTIVKNADGSYDCSGDLHSLESFVEDLTIDDEESIEMIWDTQR